MLGKQLKMLREIKKKSQQEVCNSLNIEQSTLANYENDKRTPKLEILIKLAEYYNVSVDYLLGRETIDGLGINDGDIDELDLDGPEITDILGYTDHEEKAVSFSNKLALQIDFDGLRLSDVAKSIGVPVETILEWLYEERDDYPQYYKKLSEYFHVNPSYWVRPGAVSPGLEPTTNECILILRYRHQNNPKSIKYLPIEDFFPNCRELSELEIKWLNAFRLLNEDNQDIMVGELKKCLKEQRYESVAADEPLKRTGTSLGK